MKYLVFLISFRELEQCIYSTLHTYARGEEVVRVSLVLNIIESKECVLYDLSTVDPKTKAVFCPVFKSAPISSAQALAMMRKCGTYAISIGLWPRPDKVFDRLDALGTLIRMT